MEHWNIFQKHIALIMCDVLIQKPFCGKSSLSTFSKVRSRKLRIPGQERNSRKIKPQSKHQIPCSSPSSLISLSNHLNKTCFEPQQWKSSITMDAPSSELSTCQELYFAFSFKRCFLFLLLFIILIIIAFGVGAVLIFFALKPQTPVFSLKTVNIDSYKLDVFSRSSLFVSSIVSLTLNAKNPNKVGIRYSSSRLHVVDDEGLVIGLIRVPGFYQPAKSSNISVPTRVIFDSLNVTRILSGLTQKDESNKNKFMVKILGDIEAHVRVLHIKLPKLKVALDCDVGVDYKYLTLSNGVNSLKTLKNHLEASIPAANSETFSDKCSISLYI